jgi:hypothetical protein
MWSRVGWGRGTRADRMRDLAVASQRSPEPLTAYSEYSDHHERPFWYRRAFRAAQSPKACRPNAANWVAL